MVSNKQLRSYEISVWTLQDSFITVLKESNLDRIGEIEEPSMVLKDDGENTLSFKIPMYIKNNEGKFVENPIWYNVINDTIISDLRKVKVIFNKNATDEAVYEFLITNVVEMHEGFKKYCDVSCDGLAFHELGKQGFKITFSGQDEIYAENEDWSEANLNYWADKVFNNTNWSYSVQMDWSAYDGIIDDVYTVTISGNEYTLNGKNYASFTAAQRKAFNDEREARGLRRRDKVYEDQYVSQWSVNNNIFVPVTSVANQEKYRLLDSKESNRYNLSQTIAEMFQVFCRYKYTYDSNYHIVGREAIFYNNFLNESDGIIDLTYKYETQQLKRTMDSTDLVTKMYVSPLKDSDMPSGEVRISDTPANKGLEDYLLNFDYLYGIGAITEEQYKEATTYQAKLHVINQALIPLENEKIKLDNEKIKQNARQQTAENAAKIATEQVGAMDSVRSNLCKEEGENDDGSISITNMNPQFLPMVRQEGSNNLYYSHLRTSGIIRGTLKLYLTYNSTSHALSGQITNFQIENDESGNPVKIINAKITKNNFDNRAWAIFDYIPKTYYENTSQDYAKTAQENTNIAEDAANKLVTINQQLESNKNMQESLIAQKEQVIADFVNFMGPALREGKWQPEDEYSGYGDVYNETLSLTRSSTFNNTIVSIGWDNELFDEEQKNSFYFGIEKQDYYYPCIILNSSNLSSIFSYLSNLTFVYKYPGTAENSTNACDKGYMSIGAEMLPCFIRTGGLVSPALLLVGAANASDDELESMFNTGRLSTMSFNNAEEYTETQRLAVSTAMWAVRPTQMSATSTYEIVYPRIQIDSNFVKSPETLIKVKRISTALENYTDFSVLTRDGKWYITLKPETILKTNTFFNSTNYNINFIISTAARAIYLDAVQILKENSYPKVSYDIELANVNETFIYNTYKRLGQIAHINDAEFKFENTMGYISEVDLDLDQPWQDKVVIKNYKTKFEDLFSTIVVQTEQMKKNSYIMGAVSNAFDNNGGLSNDILNTLNNLFGSSPTRVITPAEAYLQYEPFIRSELKQSWDEAGEVLAAAVNSTSEVSKLAIEGADILSGFVENVKTNLTPTSFTGVRRTNTKTGNTSLDFKVGDIWTRTIDNVTNEYLATKNSSQIDYGNITDDQKLQSLIGWSLIKDGILAAIKGATLSIDAQNGKINLLAQNELNVVSGGKLKLAGENVQIVGNDTVEIGGPDIKIYSADTTGTIDTTKGIHFYATKLGASAATSMVDITGDGITMAAANGITMKSGAGIKIYASTGTLAGTSVISIDGDDGIYIGSGKEINMYSGNITINNNGTVTTPTGSASVMQISPNRILFGVVNQTTNAGTAVEMTDDRIIIGAANIVKADSSITANETAKNNIGISSTTAENNTDNTSGVYISRTAIRLATGTGTARSYIKMDSTGLTLAKATNESYGSIVKINNGGVLIGMASKASDFTTPIVAGEAFSGTYTGARFQVYAPNFVVDADGHLYAYNADIAGTIKAYNGSIGGFNIVSTASPGTAGTNLQYFFSKTLYVQTYTKNSNNVITHAYQAGINAAGSPSEAIFYVGEKLNVAKDWTRNPVDINNTGEGNNNIKWNFLVRADGTLYATGATISGNITLTNSLPSSKVDGLDSALSNLNTTLAGITSETGTTTYARSNSGTSAPSSGWVSSIASLPALTDSNRYLWTQTVITYANGTTGRPIYSVAYIAKNGTGKYVTKITPLYYLKSNTTAPDKPGAEVTSAADSSGGWRTIVPTYISGYTYFRCEQDQWDDGNYTWTDVYQDGGLTIANSTATSASNRAAALASLLGRTFSNDGLSSGGGYAVKLTSSDRLLIGANSGIDIWNTANGQNGGAAISIDDNGIALHGAYINLTAADNVNTSAVAINADGIFLGSSKKLEIDTTNFKINSSGNVEIKGAIKATSGFIGTSASDGWNINGNTIIGTDNASIKLSDVDTNTGWQGEFSANCFYLHKQAKATNGYGATAWDRYFIVVGKSGLFRSPTDDEWVPFGILAKNLPFYWNYNIQVSNTRKHKTYASFRYDEIGLYYETTNAEDEMIHENGITLDENGVWLSSSNGVIVQGGLTSDGITISDDNITGTNIKAIVISRANGTITFYTDSYKYVASVTASSR